MENSDNQKKSGGISGVFDKTMGGARRFFAGVVAELGRCSWPNRQQLFESTILVVVAITILAFFVAGVDEAARYLIKLVTVGK